MPSHRRKGRVKPSKAECAAWADEIIPKVRQAASATPGVWCARCGEFQVFPLPVVEGEPVDLCRNCARPSAVEPDAKA